MASVQRDIEELERNLLMRSVDALADDRSLCVDCGRTPLTGEHVHLYERRPGANPDMVCELCRSCAARHRSRASSCATPSTARPCASPSARPERRGRRDAVARKHAATRLRPAVDPLTVSIVVSAPREQVFDYLQDIANHPEFTDHYLVDWHLTRIDSVGVGAGARFRVKAPVNRFNWADVTFAEVERPRRIVEVGRTGKNNRIRTIGVYELDPAAGGATRVSFTLQTAPAKLSDRLMEAFGARGWMRRKNRRALQPAARDPRGGLRPTPRAAAGAARHRRRRVDCRAHETARCASCLLAAWPCCAALALGACGDSHTKVTTGTYAGESGQNAPYLNVGPLIYQVQLSRELNPDNSEDAGYLEGLTAAQRKLRTGPGVVRASSCRSTTTPKHRTWRRIRKRSRSPTLRPTCTARSCPTQTNSYAYRGGFVPGKSQIPALEHDRCLRPHAGRAAALQDQVFSLDNRPLEVKFVDPLERLRRPLRPSSTSSHTASSRLRRVCSAASSTSRATGAAVAPPAPSLTSITHDGDARVHGRGEGREPGVGVARLRIRRLAACGRRFALFGFLLRRFFGSGACRRVFSSAVPVLPATTTPGSPRQCRCPRAPPRSSGGAP